MQKTLELSMFETHKSIHSTTELNVIATVATDAAVEMVVESSDVISRPERIFNKTTIKQSVMVSVILCFTAIVK